MAAIAWIVVGHAQAATINATSVSRSDVVAAIASASDGDTVVVPAGTASWTTTVTINKAITLQGQTTVTGPMSNPTVNNQTIILDDLDGGPGNAALLKLVTASFIRVTGITFRVGNPNRTILSVGAIKPACQSFRIDHCEFDQVRNVNVYISSERGVIDHNSAHIKNFFVAIHMETWGAGTWGDKSWSSPLVFGDEHAAFIEDNYIRGMTAGTMPATDSQGGARYVFRHNYLFNSYTDTHGTESGGRFRSPRCWEIYNNTFTLEAGRTWPMVTDARGGSGVIWGNTAIGSYKVAANFANYRDTDITPAWGGSDGTNGWDLNDTTGGPNHDGVYLSGTHTGANGSQTLVVANAGWTKNQWVKYSVKNTTTNRVSIVTSNSSDTITYLGSAFGKPQMMTFDTGQGFTIRKVIQALDHAGSGRCDALVGDTPLPHWLNQNSEPVYCWHNTINGLPGAVKSSYNIIEGRDFIVGIPRPGYTPYTYPHPLASGGGEQGHSTAAQSASKKNPGSKSQPPKVTAKHLPLKTGKKAQGEKRKQDVSSTKETTLGFVTLSHSTLIRLLA